MKKLLSVILLTLGICGTSIAQSAFTIAKVGDTAPDFTITDLKGVKHTLYDYTSAGKYVLLDLLEYDCSACPAAVPIVHQFYTKYGCNYHDVVVLGVETKGSNALLRAFLTKAKASSSTYPYASGTQGGGATVKKILGAVAYPSLVLVDPNNKYVAVDILPMNTAAQIAAAFPKGAIAVNSCTPPTAIEEDYVGDVLRDFSIYPNPTNGDITIYLDNDQINKTYFLRNSIGATVISGKITSETEKINISQLPEGLYFLNVEDDYNHVIKVVKL